MNKISRRQVAAVVADRAKAAVPVQQLAREIAAYLLTERRTGELESLIRDILEYRADHGIVEVQATVVHPLTPELRRQVTAEMRRLYPAAKQIIIDEQQDEYQLGGIRLELADRQFDASIRTRLNNFKQLTAVGKD